MTIREPLPSKDPSVRRWRVLNDQGEEIGEDREIIPTPEMANAAVLRNRILQGITVNADHLAKATTTNAQNTAHLRELTKQVNALARLVLELLNTTDGT